MSDIHAIYPINTLSDLLADEHLFGIILSLLAENGSRPSSAERQLKNLMPQIRVSIDVLKLVKKKYHQKIEERRQKFINDLSTANMAQRAYRQRFFDEIAVYCWEHEMIPHAAISYRDKESTQYQIKWGKDVAGATNALRAAAQDMAVYEKNKIERAKHRLEEDVWDDAGYTRPTTSQQKTDDTASDDAGFGRLKSAT